MNRIKNLARLWHTVKYLRPQQIFFRIYYKAFKLSTSKLVEQQVVHRAWSASWDAPSLFNSAMKENGEVCFFGKSGVVKNESDWNDINQEKLWLYHLHYLHDLNAKGADDKVFFNNYIIDQWIINNPPTKGNGWEPYPLSLRIVNLVKWFSRHGHNIKPTWLVSLGLQAQALASQIEYHILANHLFANGKALIFVGSYLGGKQGDNWLKKGLEIIDKEISEQFLPDGGHFELSPMYHANLIWDVCDLLHLSQITNLELLATRQTIWREVIIKGLKWLSIMSHPDGKISFFNDAAFEMAPEFNELNGYASQLGINTELLQENTITLHSLPDSGYYAITTDKQTKAILDLAKIGVDYQPGHAHADTLSFELSLFGQRFIVNTGTSEYGNGEDRQYQRGTSAHNTVCVNNQNSSNVWSGFRVAQRANISQVDFNTSNELIRISGSHTGYNKKPHRVIHHREWTFKAQQMIIKDSLTGVFKEAQARFYFHPLIKLIPKDNNVIHCIFPTGQVVLFKIIGTIQWLLEESYWCPIFGEKQANQCLIVFFKEKNNATVEMTW